MTYENIVTAFESVIDDNLDATLEATLANDAKDRVESMRDWEYLKDLDESQTFNSGDSYTTLHSLPLDFARPSARGIFVGTDQVPYMLIPFESRIRFQDITHRYYLKMASSQYALCGSANPGGTIHFFYQKTSPTLAAGVTPSMPARFHMLIVYEMAKKYFAVDQGDKSRAWDDRWTLYHRELLEEMVLWDEQLKRQANDHARLPVDLSGYPNIIDIDH